VDSELEAHEYLTPGEMARLFRVDPKTITRWARQGRLVAVRTPGGHRRYKTSVVKELLANLEGGEYL
jgi:excisionase family DNA binding protein